MQARMMAAIVAATGLLGGAVEAQQTASPDLFLARPETYAPRYDPSQPHPLGPVPLVPYAIPIEAPAPPRARQSAAAPPQSARGYLSLFVRPVTAQVYVDGFFVGTVDDYAGSPGPLLDPGPHRVEIRADGYETAFLDVEIVSGSVVTLREELVRPGASPAPERRVAPPATSAGPTGPFYVIPRCYAGDTRPRAEHLPAGCRLSDLRVVP